MRPLTIAALNAASGQAPCESMGGEAALWGTWTGTLHWFLASVNSCYTFVPHGNGIVVHDGPRLGVGFACGDEVSFILPCADGCPTTGTLTLMGGERAKVVVGGCGVQFEGQQVKQVGKQAAGAFKYAPPPWVNSI